ncbi:hypothetical protein BCR44DRAFT_333632 [Catenaria anguillulae PL171]|uniref:Uncharacterized protein n=1 Tax=Catenaria anguillulae PL171 TaxID=765915 RepID=A0A1Y2I4T2_9FUNG|nr:hypothetical protein BCR44DRAFT_333632 [Catenaria anguillulae PL171]
MHLDQGPLDLGPVLSANSPIPVPGPFAPIAPIGAWTHVDAADARAALAAVRELKRIRAAMRALDARLLALSQHALEMVPEHKRPKPKAIADPAHADAEAALSSEPTMPSSETTPSTVPSSGVTTTPTTTTLAPSSSVPGSDASDVVMVSSDVDLAAPKPPVCGCPIKIDEAEGRVVKWCERVKCSKHGMWRKVFKARLEMERVKLVRCLYSSSILISCLRRC